MSILVLASLHHRERDRILSAVPGKFQNSTLPRRLDCNRELFNWCGERAGGEIDSRKITLRVVVRSPLACLTVDDKLRSVCRRQRPQRVFAGGQMGAAD